MRVFIISGSLANMVRVFRISEVGGRLHRDGIEVWGEFIGFTNAHRNNGNECLSVSIRINVTPGRFDAGPGPVCLGELGTVPLGSE